VLLAQRVSLDEELSQLFHQGAASREELFPDLSGKGFELVDRLEWVLIDALLLGLEKKGMQEVPERRCVRTRRDRGRGSRELNMMSVLVDGGVHQLVVVLEVLVVDDDLAGVGFVQAVHPPAFLPRLDDGEVLRGFAEREEEFFDLLVAH
jgi:hypothetical protein